MSANEILRITADHTGIPISEILGKSQKREIVAARHCAMWQIKKTMPQMSYAQIGLIFSRDHSTVIHAMGHVDDMVDTKDKAYLWIVERYKTPTNPHQHVYSTDKELNWLFYADSLLQKRLLKELKTLLGKKIRDRAIALDSLEAMKVDQILHEQSN